MVNKLYIFPRGLTGNRPNKPSNMPPLDVLYPQRRRHTYAREDRPRRRLWTAIAEEKGRDDYATALTLTYYAGLRVEECFSIDTAMAEKALRDGGLTFHGKGGRWRSVPINERIANQLRLMLSNELGKPVRKTFYGASREDVAKKVSEGTYQVFSGVLTAPAQENCPRIPFKPC